MKNQFCRTALSGLLAVGLALSPAAVFAQQDNPAPGNGGGRFGHQQMDPDQQLARMTKHYNLSADQQAQIKPILVNQQQQMQALRQDSSLSREDRMAKMKGIREDSSTKIQALLNDTQKQQFAQGQQQMQQRMQEHGGGAPPTQ